MILRVDLLWRNAYGFYIHKLFRTVNRYARFCQGIESGKAMRSDDFGQPARTVLVEVGVSNEEFGYMKPGASLKWLEHISVVEVLVIRLGGLILVTIFIAKAILHEFGR